MKMSSEKTNITAAENLVYREEMYRSASNIRQSTASKKLLDALLLAVNNGEIAEKIKAFEIEKIKKRIDSVNFKQEMTYFRNNNKMISEKYAGQYIAILGSSLVDFNHDLGTLVDRIENILKTNNVMIKQIPLKGEAEQILPCMYN